jgi:quinol monooxygenase YgiN
MREYPQHYLVLVGRYEVDPQDSSAFASIAAQCVAQTTVKPGCLYFTIAQDVTNPGVFHLSEGWVDRAALDAHLASADFATIVEQVSRLRLRHREAYVSQATGRGSLFS